MGRVGVVREWGYKREANTRGKKERYTYYSDAMINTWSCMR